MLVIFYPPQIASRHERLLHSQWCFFLKCLHNRRLSLSARNDLKRILKEAESVFSDRMRYPIAFYKPVSGDYLRLCKCALSKILYLLALQSIWIIAMFWWKSKILCLEILSNSTLDSSRISLLDFLHQNGIFTERYSHTSVHDCCYHV